MIDQKKTSLIMSTVVHVQQYGGQHPAIS